MMRLYIIAAILICCAVTPANGNTTGPDSLRLQTIEAKLAAAARADPAFTREVDLSVGKISLPEMLRNIAKVSDVNLTVKGAENTMVSVNFSRARVADLIYYLCREYGLDIEVVGNIVSIFPLKLPPPQPREIKVVYDTLAGTIGFDLLGDNLVEVARNITLLSGINLVVPQSLYQRKVSGYVQAMPFDQAMETLVEINGLQAEKNSRGIWTFGEDTTGGQSGQLLSARRDRFPDEELSIDSLGLITARLAKANVYEVIADLCERQRLNYFFLSRPDHQTGIFVREVDFMTLLDLLLAGTPSSYYVDNGIYIFGNEGQGGKLTSYQIVPLYYRSVSNIEGTIPASLKTNIQIQTFADLNSLIISGEQKQVSRVAGFVRSIDRRVPMITIEVMIVDVTKTDLMEAGLGIGLGEGGGKTSGTLSPGISMNLNSQSVNNLISGINGISTINLGKVTPQFYMDIKMLEDRGVLQLRSTPRLSTLNGQEATLKSGETRYYKEITNNYIGYQNPTLTENYIWKSIDANLSVKIIPFVSEGHVITLDIEIEQTEFMKTETAEDAPPATATRSFKSIIKVENGDMVLLGGIDRNTMEKNAKGLPFISRVPVLKWIFGNSRNNKSDQKLSVFIKPTVTY